MLLGACYTCSKSANFFEFYSAFFADSYAQDVMKIVKNQVVPILQIPVRLILRFTLLASCLFCSLGFGAYVAGHGYCECDAGADSQAG